MICNWFLASHEISNIIRQPFLPSSRGKIDVFHVGLVFLFRDNCEIGDISDLMFGFKD